MAIGNCRGAGYNPDDVQTYAREYCQKKGGWKAFDSELMRNVKAHGRRKLLCKTCVPQLATKTKELRRKLQKSKRVCNCSCPIHRDKCLLSPCRFHDTSWPGSDGYISAEERTFLDNLNPEPEWWAKAWGRRNSIVASGRSAARLRTSLAMSSRRLI